MAYVLGYAVRLKKSLHLEKVSIKKFSNQVSIKKFFKPSLKALVNIVVDRKRKKK